MATYKSSDNIDKKYVQCPYEASHYVPANRLAVHLVKCEQTSSKVLWTCPFNGLHRVAKDQMQVHLNQCPSRVAIINRDLMIGPYVKPNDVTTRVPAIKKESNSDGNDVQSTDESWD